MWYAIFMSIGLGVGIAMLIWAVIERKKRYQAELQVKEEKEYRKKAEEVADNNGEVLLKVKEDLERANNTVKILYKELDELKVLLLKSGDSKALKEWLESELKGGVI